MLGAFMLLPGVDPVFWFPLSPFPPICPSFPKLGAGLGDLGYGDIGGCTWLTIDKEQLKIH